MAKSANKKRNYAFLLEPEISDLINAHLGANEQISRSEFVAKTVRLYCNKLDNHETRMFLDDEIVSSINANTRDAEERIFSHLQSMDISLSVLSVLFAANLANMSNEDIALMRRDAVRYVTDNHKAKSFVTALREQQGEIY